MKFFRRMGRDLADVETCVQTRHVLHDEPPVVWVAEGGGDAGVPGVGDVPHGQKVGGGEDGVSQPGDLTTLSQTPPLS